MKFYNKLVKVTSDRGTTVETEVPDIPKIGMIAAAAIASIITISALWPFHTVPTGSRGVITQFGQIKSIEAEGLVIMPPWQKLDLFNVRAETADIDNAQGATSDTQPVAVSMTVRYSITPDKVSEVFEKYSRNGDLTSYVTTATMETFKAVTAKYSASDLIAKRALVSADVNSALAGKLQLYGAQVVNIDMRNFAFSDSYMAAINEKVTQDQLRQAAENKVKTIEAEQRAKIVTAEAEATSLKVKADGEAYANLSVAKAQAEALRVQNQALAQNKDVLELRRIEVDMEKAQRWNGVLPVNVYGSAPIPFMNMK